jgi:hypothetical protein
MSKSFRHTPIFGNTTATTESTDKTIWHRRFRRQTKLSLVRMDDPDGYVPPAVRELSNPWAMPKDGRSYWTASEMSLGARSLRK